MGCSLLLLSGPLLVYFSRLHSSWGNTNVDLRSLNPGTREAGAAGDGARAREKLSAYALHLRRCADEDTRRPEASPTIARRESGADKRGCADKQFASSTGF